ncbi:hypothetical protein [Nocardioides taihuensis]|uniref:Uncharacterized protein n=1 Tax=Nocardioides taihuensis TaxID=1835606 RepID=A0ABW0BDJ7_9ACTN
MDASTRPSDDGWYEIRLSGHLDQRWSAWLDGAGVTPGADGTTVVRARVADQAALHGLLAQVRDLGLPLLSLVRVEPDPPHPTRGD